MPPKPHRVLLDRVSGYADEAAAYMRRRRHLRKPFVRLYFTGGRAEAVPSDTDESKALFLDAAKVIEIAGPPRPEARQARAGATRRQAGTNDERDLVAVPHKPGISAPRALLLSAPTPISEEEPT